MVQHIVYSFYSQIDFRHQIILLHIQDIPDTRFVRCVVQEREENVQILLGGELVKRGEYSDAFLDENCTDSRRPFLQCAHYRRGAGCLELTSERNQVQSV